MKCARCLAEIPAQSQFCLRCGAPMHVTSINPSGGLPGLPSQPSGGLNQRLVAVLVAAFVLMSAIGIGAFVIGKQSSRLPQSPAMDSPSANVVQAPQPTVNTPAITQAPAESDPVNVVQGPAKTGAPDDVVAYLDFVKQIELKKEKLHADQVRQIESLASSSMMNQMSAAPPTDDASDGSTAKKDAYEKDVKADVPKLDGPWNDLAAEFAQHPVPDSCAAAYKAYYAHLGKAQAAIVYVADILGRMQHTDPMSAVSQISRMRSSGAKLDEDVDVSGRQAEDAIAAVCSKFGIVKDFSVRTVTATSSDLVR